MDPLIESLRQAVRAAPDDDVLRLHLAEQLLNAGDTAGAIAEASNVLRHDPVSTAARELMSRAIGTAPTPQQAGPTKPASPAGAAPPATPEPAALEPEAPERAIPEPDAPKPEEFDWLAAEEQLGGPQPQFVDGAGPDVEVPAYDTEQSTLKLADVGGMEQVKHRLEVAFLAPARNTELRELYGKSLRGGLLLYGPPGCGKTFIARAVAGELGANFLSVGISDVLDMYIGNSERNLHELFEQARRKAPCVLFFDELDALGQRRNRTVITGLRTTVNQLLAEMDGVHAANSGVFVLAATNQPWDVDPALRRPGRFDRMVLVLPPDPAARRAILCYHLRDRPVEGVDLGALASRTDGYSGADLAHVCETAAERALADSIRSGEVRMITMADLEAALTEVRPSTGPWFESARSVAMFANEGGAYDDLVDFLKQRGMR